MARYAGGWFKAWREAWSKDLSDNLVLWGVWNAFLHMATWKDSQIIWQGRQRVIPAGTVVFGVSELADKWGVSKSTISRWVRYLVSTERIRYESGTDGSLATILNWETYQAQVEASETLAEHKLDADRTPGEREVALNEEGKKERKKKTPGSAYPEEFETLYRLYPRKEGKSEGFAVYQRLIKTDEDRAKLQAAITSYAKKKAGSEVKYLRMFGTFMNSWTDWLDPTTGQGPAAPAPVALKTLEDLEREEGAGHA